MEESNYIDARSIKVGLTEFWQPTFNLRWVNRPLVNYDKQSVKQNFILQQEHRSNKGNTKWEDVPTAHE